MRYSAWAGALAIVACAAPAPPLPALLLSGEQGEQFGAATRACWTRDSGAPDLDRMSVLFNVTYDETGTGRAVDVAEPDRPRLAEPLFRAFAERARRAVLSPRCSRLPVPPEALGRIGTVTFRFRP